MFGASVRALRSTAAGSSPLGDARSYAAADDTGIVSIRSDIAHERLIDLQSVDRKTYATAHNRRNPHYAAQLKNAQATEIPSSLGEVRRVVEGGSTKNCGRRSERHTPARSGPCGIPLSGGIGTQVRVIEAQLRHALQHRTGRCPSQPSRLRRTTSARTLSTTAVDDPTLTQRSCTPPPPRACWHRCAWLVVTPLLRRPHCVRGLVRGALRLCAVTYRPTRASCLVSRSWQ